MYYKWNIIISCYKHVIHEVTTISQEHVESVDVLGIMVFLRECRISMYGIMSLTTTSDDITSTISKCFGVLDTKHITKFKF